MNRTILTVVLVTAFGMTGCHASSESKPKDTNAASSASTSNEREQVVGMGRIKPVGGVIDVGAMMGDRLGALLVKEGDQVKKGKPLAEMESRDLRALQVEGAKLSVKKAQAAELSVAAHLQKIELLKVGLALSKKDQERIEGLTKDLVSDQERERQALVVQQAATELESAQVMLRQLQTANELGLEAAKLELKTAETQFARTQITAPCDGTILRIYARPGETIGAKPILQMANLDRMVVVVEVYENEVKHLQDGQAAEITSKAFHSPYDQKGLQGKVSRIGRMINVPLLKNVDPFAPADRHVVEACVEFDAEGSRETASLSNLQVDVRFPKEGGTKMSNDEIQMTKK